MRTQYVDSVSLSDIARVPLFSLYLLFCSYMIPDCGCGRLAQLLQISTENHAGSVILQVALRFEITDLQQTMETFGKARASICQSPFCLGHGKELGTLEVIEVGQLVKREPLGFGQQRQPPAAAGTGRLVGTQWPFGELNLIHSHVSSGSVPPTPA